MTPTNHDPIALVGIGCRFPGGVTDAASFWQLIANGVDAIADIPASRFDAGAYVGDARSTPGRIASGQGGFIDQRLEDFDAPFFGISRAYAERLDPQQRLLLETAWEAMEDAGMDVSASDASQTGVFVGQWTSDFEHRVFANEAAIDFPSTLGSGRYAAAGRLSYAFGFRGPSLSVDAACSSGLAAVHLAVQSLRRGECAAALAGGVNVILEPHLHIGYSQNRMLSRDGRCKFGDASADGYVRAEGAGIVVLKRLADAMAHGDRVYAVIRGSAMNNDGDSSGAMGRPSRLGQEELLRAALRDGDVPASQLDYVEAHGTGTRAGDPVELGALATVVSEGRAPDASRLLVGSVKTNIGHTEAAAGVAGLIKTSLMLQHGMIAPSLHFHAPTPEVAWATVPLTVPTTLVSWPARDDTRFDGSRFAGVSSYGIGGTNAHVVLQSVSTRVDHDADAGFAAAIATAPDATTARDTTPFVLPLSARSDAALRALAGRYAELLTARDAPSVRDVCWSAATRRTPLSHRAAFVADDRVTLKSSLRAFADGDETSATEPITGTVHTRSRRRVAFVVPGQGAQWVGMARQFVADAPVFRAALVQCDAAMRAHASWSIMDQLFLDADAPGFLGHRIDVVQPTLVALAIAYAAWLQSVGIEPDAVVGHSLGEVGAAAIAGVISIPEAMRLIVTRSALMQRTSGQGAMAIVELSRDAALQRLREHDLAVTVAVSNSPRSSVISGTPDDVARMLALLEQDGVFCRKVNVDVAAHSAQMAPLAPELVRALHDLAPSDAKVTLYSTVTATAAHGLELDAAYWGRNLTQPVQFGETVTRMLDDGIGAFIELGPHPVLTQSVLQVAHAAAKDAVSVACGRRELPEQLTAMSVIAALWASGASVNWSRVMGEAHAVVNLPSYPWQRERYWADTATRRASRDGSAPRAPLSAAARRMLHTFEWQPVLLADDTTERTSWRWLVVGDEQHGADVLAAALLARGSDATVVRNMHDAGALARSWPMSAQPIGVVVLPVRDDSVAHASAPARMNSDASAYAYAHAYAYAYAYAYAPVAGLEVMREAWPDAPGTSTPRVWWVTQGAHAVAKHAPSPHCAERAALWGAARVLAEEHPAWWGGLVDLDATGDIGAHASVLAAHLTCTAQEDQVALRDGQRFALRLVHAADVQTAPLVWRADTAYLLTGGLGGVSLQMAASMVRGGARRLVLLGHTPLPPRAEWRDLDPQSVAGKRVSSIRALEHLGASVHLMHADVADEASVRQALALYDAEGWPPISGVIHNAAVIDNRLSRDMTSEVFARVLRPKLAGAQVLDRVFPDVELFVLSSSISAYWAPPGMTNYAAANAGCDALAAERRARGRHAISIQWCAWQGVGMADVDAMQRNVEAMSQFGVHALSADEGTALFDAALTRPESVLALLPIDWSMFRQARRGRRMPLFLAIPEASASTDDTPANAVLRGIRDASGAERRMQLDTLVRRVVSAVLRRPATTLDARQSFGSLGVDSLMGLEIRNRLETALEQSLSATLAWNYPTIESLSEHLHALLVPVATSPPVRQPRDMAAATVDVKTLNRQLDDIASLSDDDAMRVLRRAR